MPRKKKPQPPKKPKGIRERVLADGTVKYDPLVRINGKQVTLGTCDTFDEAAAMRWEHFQSLKAKGEEVRSDAGILTVRQLGELCPMKEWDEDRWRARVMQFAHFADWPATQVSEEDVQLWVDKMANTPLTYGKNAGQLPTRPTVYSALSLLKRVFEWARKPARKYVAHNPAAHVTIRNSTDVRLKSQRNVLDYLREDEARKLLEADEPDLPLKRKAMFVTLMVAGARPSDVWRLRWERFDWKAETIRFTSQKTGKEKASDYTVHPLPQLMAVLKKWWMASGRPSKGLVFPAGVGKDGEQLVYARGYDGGWSDKKERRHYVWYVDNTEDGSLSADSTRPKRATRTGEQAKELRKKHGERREGKSALKTTKGWRTKLGITRDVPLYALRHTCASHLLLGTPLFTGGRAWSREEVQAQLGHADSAATEFYMRSLGILGRRAVEDSKDALGRSRMVKSDG